MRFEIHQAKDSFAYKRAPGSAPAWYGNDNHNSLDLFILFDDSGEAIFHTNCQTISNSEGLIDGARYIDTLAPGPVSIKTDVEQRSFWCRIHGIVQARTIAGEEIRDDSTTKTNQSRWLVHDWQKHRPNPQGQDTRAAWSAGCVVMPDASLVQFGSILDQYGINPGTIIPGILKEEVE